VRNEQRREETRAALMEAATQAFSERGYDATGVAEICRRAGVSKGAFYYHFESKQAIFMALVAAWLSELEQALGPAFPGAGSASDRLQELSHRFRDVLASQSPRVTLILEFWTQASRNEAIRQTVLTLYRAFQSFFEGLIQDGIGEGSLRGLDSAVVSRVVLAIASGLFFQGLLDPEGTDWGALAEESVRILMSGIGGGG